MASSSLRAGFCVGAGNAICPPHSTTALCHSHPHWQQTESDNRGFLRSALHTAHDLIHMVFSPNRIRIGLDSIAGPYALFRVFSVCIGPIQVGMAPRCGALLRTNGTAVPDGITFRPFLTNFDGYSFWGAGSWALQIVVTRLNLHWPIARRQSNADIARLLNGRFCWSRGL